MRRFRTTLIGSLVASALCLAPLAAPAQIFSGDWAKELQNDQPSPKTAEQKRVEQDILGLQAAVRAATIAKDKEALEKYFADDYTMTHGGGALQNRDIRIDFITKGNGGFEAMTPDVQSIRVLGRDAAVSIANNALQVNGQTGWIRYMIVYERGTPSEGYKGWREVAAHVIAIFSRPRAATAPAEAPPAAKP